MSILSVGDVAVTCAIVVAGLLVAGAVAGTIAVVCRYMLFKRRPSVSTGISFSKKCRKQWKVAPTPISSKPKL